MPPSYKVMKIDEWKDEIFYRIACNCGSSDCDMHMTLKLDRKTGYISMLFEKKMLTSTSWDIQPVFFDLFGDPWEVTKDNIITFLQNLWVKFKNKLKYTWDIWIHGYVESSADLLINEEKHIDAFVDAILSGKGELTKIFEDHRLESIKNSEEAAKNKQKESRSINDIQEGKDNSI